MMNRRVIRLFLVIAIPMALIWTGILANNLWRDKQYAVAQTISENELKDYNTSVLVERYISEIIENLKVIRDSNELNNYLNAMTTSNREDLVALFARIMANKSDYDQLRYIDVSGQEVVRVDNDESVHIISSADLGDKRDRSYFIETMTLSANEIYVSPMDLNVENNEIEIPDKPMLRFATPVFDAQNVRRGILIINYKADYFLDMMHQRENHGGVRTEQFYILNKDGQYIVHPDETLNFSFMKPGYEILKFDNQAIWEEISVHASGYVETQDRLYTYHDVLNLTRASHVQYLDQWILVHEINTADMFTLGSLWREVTAARNLAVFTIIALLSFVSAHLYDRLIKKDAQLNIAMKIAEASSEAVIITDKETHITYVNEAYESYTGYRADEVIGLKPSRFKSGKHSRGFYENMWHDINEFGYWQGMLWDRKKDGLIYPKRLRIIAVKNKGSREVDRYIGIFSDLSLNGSPSDTNETLGYREGQLVLPNEELMLELLGQSITHDDFNFMILYIAIENYNQLASAFDGLKEKSSDVFLDLIKPQLGEDDFVAQTGRNLFAIIINLKHIEEAPEDFVKRIHKEMTRVIEINGTDIFFKTRVGISYWPQDTTDLRRLLLNSMIALEWTGRNKGQEIAFFNDKMIEALNRENEIEGYLRKAILEDEFHLVYQPQVDIQSGRIVGMEALIRWESKVLGSVSPSVFIPVAERNNFIIDIGDWVVDRVCKDLAYMNQQCTETSARLKCAVNLSAIQMMESTFLDRLFEIINRNEIAYSQLEMEITESMLLKDDLKHIRTLSAIQESGMSVAIDDFGTGYSSLSYLNALPVDKIKIDRSFIKNYPDSDDGTLIKILVDMSQQLHKSVLVEGAESEEQVAFLRTIGCDYIQGYYYSKPLALDAFIEFVKR
ncbi:MAG: EAL domain-containing protein [Clostridia bacterium]|nr:EAL domain-containing protein [Clostridia bacterium]